MWGNEMFRVIGIGADNSRNVIAEGLGRTGAEAVRRIAINDGRFREVLIESDGEPAGRTEPPEGLSA